MKGYVVIQADIYTGMIFSAPGVQLIGSSDTRDEATAKARKHLGRNPRWEKYLNESNHWYDSGEWLHLFRIDE